MLSTQASSGHRPALIGIEARVGKRMLPYLFLAPLIGVIVLLLLVPVFMAVSMSFQRTALDGSVSWEGIGNYIRILRQTRFRTNVMNSLAYVVGNVGISVPLAFCAALLTTSKFKQASFFRSIFLLPWISAPVVSTVLFRAMLQPRIGPIARLLTFIAGEEVVALSNPFTAMVFVTIHSIWRSFPFIMLFLSAGLAAIPDELTESALVEGAGPWQRFVRLTLPMVSNQLGIALILITMWTLQDAETIYAFTQGGPGYSTETLAVRLFKMAFVNFDLNSGATIGMLLILLSTAFMAVYLRIAVGKDIER